jgi:hypothetical protein
LEADGLARLRRNLVEQFNLDDLRTLCFDLGIDYEQFPGTINGMTREILRHFYRQKQMDRLIIYCSDLRPTINWAAA